MLFPTWIQFSYALESTDAAPEVPHPCLTRDAASDAVARVSVRVCVFFFFFLEFVPTRLNSRRRGSIHAESASICAESGWPKSALNMAGKAETCLLLSFFCESRHSNVFFKNILIVKIYRKYK